MALFNDGRITTSDDLRAYESSILDVASSEGIELDAKIALASAEIGQQISRALLSHYANSWCAGAYAGRTLDCVVVTDALKNWHTLHTLALIFRDAYSSQLNDRYRAKWNEYQALATEAAQTLFDIGIGMSSDPVSGADLPLCSAVNGGVLPAATYTVQIAWQSPLGRCGALSEPCVFKSNAGQLLTVGAGPAPRGTAGWSVYVGDDRSDPTQQNTVLLPASQTWTMPVPGLINGGGLPVDLPPDYYVQRSRIFRG